MKPGCAGAHICYERTRTLLIEVKFSCIICKIKQHVFIIYFKDQIKSIDSGLDNHISLKMGKFFFFVFLFSSVDETKILLTWQLAIFIIFILLDIYDGVHQLQIFLFVHTLRSSFSTKDGGVSPLSMTFTFR